MRIVDIRQAVVPISRYADLDVPSGGLDTGIVALVTDVVRDGCPVVGYGFASMGRFAQRGLIADRFAPRLLDAPESEIATDDGMNIDPFRAWNAVMAGEKPGGHGERCVAVGTLDMALWDAAAKIADEPLFRYLPTAIGEARSAPKAVPVYAGGGYRYPTRDLECLQDEIRCLRDLGYDRVKIKIGSAPLEWDLRRIDAAVALLPEAGNLAVDAIYSFDIKTGRAAAQALAPYGLWWFEDICDPLDFDTHRDVVSAYDHPVAAGEGLFSAAEARLLDRYGGLRRDRDILLFDPVHCYGLPGYLQILRTLQDRGWPRSAFWPHGGHLFCLHVVSALGLGGAEVNPLCFQPFGGLGDAVTLQDGRAAPPDAPGIGFETKPVLHPLFTSLLDD
jgi:L-alanine-DL-glutamate epimerase-like enolase superfamily enzyme